MDPERAREWAEILKALAHPTRLQILDTLRGGTQCVTDIEQILPASQTNISQHLAVLRNAKLVDFAQDGAVRCYYVSRPQLVNVVLETLMAEHPVTRKSKDQILLEKKQNNPLTEGKS